MKKKIYHYLELSEDKEEYMNKINDTLLSSVEEVILTALGKILPLKNTNEMLYLFYIAKMGEFILKSINKSFTCSFKNSRLERSLISEEKSR